MSDYLKAPSPDPKTTKPVESVPKTTTIADTKEATPYSLLERENLWKDFDWGNHLIVFPSTPPSPPDANKPGLIATNIPDSWTGYCGAPPISHPIIQIWVSTVIPAISKLIDDLKIPMDTLILLGYHQKGRTDTTVAVISVGAHVQDTLDVTVGEEFIRRGSAILRSHQLEDVYVSIGYCKPWGGAARRRMVPM